MTVIGREGVATPKRRCWCGTDRLSAFSADYSICGDCGTLVSQRGLAADEISVSNDDEGEFYGRHYWLTRPGQDLGYPDVFARARSDLPERCLHWLRKYL